ncbi:hypothetical protein EMMF5_000475 [Cystobasidiomycetes sp. EMM_F5]
MPAPHILPPDDEAVPTASADNHDVEARHSVKTAAPDIEHVYVEDDPRNWSSRKKYFTFFFVCYAAMAAAVSANIVRIPASFVPGYRLIARHLQFFPAIDDLQRDLQASQQVINLSVSLFILFQGTVPILWSGISEIYGRKIVYLSAYAIFTASQIGCALSKNQAMFLAFRIIGACGSSAGLTIGGGTIADIYDQHERGTRIGVYYLFPLLGPSLGTLLGGALTLTPAGWRASFWFLVAYGASTFVWTLFFKDTFRKERSLAWTKAMRRAQDAAKAKDAARKAQNGSHSPVRSIRMPWSHSRPTSRPDSPTDTPVQAELPTPSPFDGGRGLKKVVTESGEEVPVKVHLADINPLSAVGVILRQPANSLAIVASGLLFGGQYSLVFTGALSFADAPYSYSSLEVGLVLLCFGVGNIVGSVCGGKYSDIVLAKFKSRYGGKAIAEWRLRATLWAMPFVPLTFVA